MKQITQTFLEGESPSLNVNRLLSFWFRHIAFNYLVT